MKQNFEEFRFFSINLNVLHLNEQLNLETLACTGNFRKGRLATW